MEVHDCNPIWIIQAVWRSKLSECMYLEQSWVQFLAMDAGKRFRSLKNTITKGELLNGQNKGKYSA